MTGMSFAVPIVQYIQHDSKHDTKTLQGVTYVAESYRQKIHNILINIARVLLGARKKQRS